MTRHIDEASRNIEVARGIVIQASNLEARIMRHELTDHAWAAIKPMFAEQIRVASLHFTPCCAASGAQES